MSYLALTLAMQPHGFGKIQTEGVKPSLLFKDLAFIGGIGKGFRIAETIRV